MNNQTESANQFNEYNINENNEIVWRKNLQQADKCFKTQPVENIINLLHSIGFNKPVVNDSGFFCRVLKGDVSRTEFNTEMDAYIDCYTYALEHKLI